MITIGIETSCDETSVGLLDDDRFLEMAVYSQAEHARFGGVVPEIASRAHLEKIDRLTAAVLEKVSLSVGAIGLIAVTDSPGLAGALLVGVSFALGLHERWKIPCTGINHLEAHICSIFLQTPYPELPFIALLVSGGHTALYRVDEIGNYTCLGQTVDDAAGEAFDKVGKMLGFPYPAGRLIEQEAGRADTDLDVSFPIARAPGSPFNFSFSGLKTAVKYYIAEKGGDFARLNRPRICKAFQTAVIGSLVNNCTAAARETGLRRIAVVGGVACNGTLRRRMQERFGNDVYFPSPALCMDNGAMVACAGYRRASKNELRFPRMDPNAVL